MQIRGFSSNLWENLWSLSLKWNEIILVLLTSGKFYVKSPRQAEMTKHWEIFKDFISLPDNDKVHFVLAEGKSNLIYRQLLQCHDPHFTFFKQPQHSNDVTVLPEWGWSTAKRLTDQGLPFTATSFFVKIKLIHSMWQPITILWVKRNSIYTTFFWKGQIAVKGWATTACILPGFPLFLLLCLFQQQTISLLSLVLSEKIQGRLQGS